MKRIPGRFRLESTPQRIRPPQRMRRGGTRTLAMSRLGSTIDFARKSRLPGRLPDFGELETKTRQLRIPGKGVRLFEDFDL